MKQTAVEWLIEQIQNNHTIGYNSITLQQFEKAKAMEKEQIISAWWSGENDSSFDPKILDEMAEQYYNETYQNK